MDGVLIKVGKKESGSLPTERLHDPPSVVQLPPVPYTKIVHENSPNVAINPQFRLDRKTGMSSTALGLPPQIE